MLDIITNNPFRVLGVYANVRPADIVSNCDDMEAYLAIGQSVSFDLDFNNLMPAVKRTQETVAQAKSKINLPKDKLKYALFWFVKDSSSAHAMNYLKNGDFDNADNVFEIEDAFSTRINKAVLAMMQDDLGTAIANITEMIHNNGFRNGFVKDVCGDAFSISEDEMAHLFINALLEEMSAGELLELYKKHGVSKGDNNYLKTKAVDEPISRINAEISKAKSVRRDDADANYRAGKDLMGNTKSDLAKVKNLQGATNMQYQMLADDLADAIMQCGINYYNASEDNDKIENALGLQEYACKIAVGRLCKERCDKNLESLKKQKENAAPLNVRGEDSNIKQALVGFKNKTHTIGNAIELIKTCVPYLISMKETLGGNDPYYLKMSTIVVNAALIVVIEVVNEAQERVNSSFQLGELGAYYSLTADLLLGPTIKEAWEATLYMGRLNMEHDFKINRFNPNRNTLESIAEQLNISLNDTSIELDMRTEREFIDTMTTSSQYEEYKRRYPHGKYPTEAKHRYDNLKRNEEKKAYDACTSSEKCKSYLQKYPNGKYVDEVTKKYEILKTREEEKRLIADEERKKDDLAFEQCRTKSDFKKYLKLYPKGNHKWQAKNKIDEIKEKNTRIGCIVAIIALILVGGIIGAIVYDSGEGFLIGCGLAVVFLLYVWLKAL